MDLKALRAAARLQRAVNTEKKNAALMAIAQALLANAPAVLAANKEDLERLPADTTPAFRDRLLLNTARLEGMAESLRQVADLPDPVGEVVEQRTLANGLKLRRVRSPLGVIFMIFESRPNVILEAFSLAFKAGNVILLRGGSESRSTAAVIYDLMGKTLAAQGFTTPPFIGVQDYARELVADLLIRSREIDIVVPRGGDGLIDYVQRTARMPIIKNDRGMCHAYVDDEADLEMAVRVVNNGKTHRPGVCNALETVLVHQKIAAKFLPQLYSAMPGVQWHCDEPALKILYGRTGVQAAQTQDWDTEYLDMIINCHVVSGLDEALAHIEQHGSRHSEAIITASPEKAKRFQEEVDAAAVYWNASTRFTDGFELGLGGELGISTQKLHVRGPVGLRELTSVRWIADGSGQIR
jgi:glutamate-5-semialdehyde dehydrogenase